MSKKILSAEEPAESVPVSAESDKKTAAMREVDKKIMWIAVVMQERLKVVEAYLALIVKILSDELPGKVERVHIVNMFAEHDARTRQ